MLLWGYNLFGASVEFNGVPAAKAVSSGPSIRATVPEGATSGPITVTTPGGTSTTRASFTINLAPRNAGQRAPAEPCGPLRQPSPRA